MHQRERNQKVSASVNFEVNHLKMKMVMKNQGLGSLFYIPTSTLRVLLYIKNRSAGCV